jgi:hypothetical protein
MTVSIFADGFINSPGFGALLALAGTVIGAGGSIWIADRARGQQRADLLREALSAVLRQRHSFATKPGRALPRRNRAYRRPQHHRRAVL